jgi:fatty-acyl-CoA synthase
LPQTEVRIADSADGVVAIGDVGELCVRGYLVMAGYRNMAEESATAIDSDGWYHTGDLASMDERGFLRMEGRVKDMIIRGGENIYPREIEDVLFGHPDVAEAAVVGIPDDHWGEVVAAFIRPALGAKVNERELRDYCRQHLAAFKTPASWVEVSEFPLTASGKIQKFKLREGFAGPSRPAEGA